MDQMMSLVIFLLGIEGTQCYSYHTHSQHHTERDEGEYFSSRKIQYLPRMATVATALQHGNEDLRATGKRK